MLDLSMIRNWIAVPGLAFLGIVGGLMLCKYIGAKNIPLLTPIANGIITIWKAAGN